MLNYEYLLKNNKYSKILFLEFYAEIGLWIACNAKRINLPDNFFNGYN